MHIQTLEGRPLTDIAARAAESGLLPQHHPIWAQVLCGMGEECRGLVATDGANTRGWVLYAVSRGPYGTVVSSLPYVLFGGPAVPDGDPRVVTALLEALRREAESLGADVLSVGTSPLLTEETEAAYRGALGVTHELENFVQLQELQVHPLDSLTPKRRRAVRSEINRGIRHGLRVLPSLTASQVEEWQAIYQQRYLEMDARPYPPAFHRNACELAVRAGAAEFWGVADGDRLVGGVLFLISRDVVDYFSSASLSDYRHLFPTTLILNEAFSTFMARGVKVFNWQSSPNREGVYQYKARWGAREWRYFYLSSLLRPDTALLRTPVEEVRRAYPLRFVLPFSLWSHDSRGASAKP